MNYELRTIVRKEKSFSLVETVTALVILAIVCSGVVVVISRCIASAADSQIRMQAFEVARENMEKLLASNLLKETVEYGNSDKYPDIKWQTVVETFYEPITARMWVRGICSAEYTDTEGKTQTVELTHWLTNVTKEQLLQIMANKEKEKQKEQELLGGQIIGTMEAAAKYAGVDVATIQKWVENGMVTMEDGSFVKKNLDIFKGSEGNPTTESKNQQIKSEPELIEVAKEQAKEQGKSAETEEPTEAETPAEDDWLNQIEPTTGLTYGEIEKMSFQEVWDLFMSKIQQRQ
jgi:type II secretory pathway pseudopilin PulG